MVTADSLRLIEIKAHWDRGVLPLAGGLLDQPQGIIAAIDALRRATDRAYADRAEKDRRK